MGFTDLAQGMKVHIAPTTKNGFSGEVAGELGLEPRLTESESVVLPLDDSPKGSWEWITQPQSVGKRAGCQPFFTSNSGPIEQRVEPVGGLASRTFVLIRIQHAAT